MRPAGFRPTHASGTTEKLTAARSHAKRFDNRPAAIRRSRAGHYAVSSPFKNLIRNTEPAATAAVPNKTPTTDNQFNSREPDVTHIAANTVTAPLLQFASQVDRHR